MKKYTHTHSRALTPSSEKSKKSGRKSSVKKCRACMKQHGKNWLKTDIAMWCLGMRVSGDYKFRISEENLFTDNDDKHAHTHTHRVWSMARTETWSSK